MKEMKEKQASQQWHGVYRIQMANHSKCERYLTYMSNYMFINNSLDFFR